MRDGAEALKTSAQPGEAARPRTNKEERPKVDRERWKSLNTYLAGPPTNVFKRRSSSNVSSAHHSVELSIRGAAGRGGDSASRTRTPTEDPSTLYAPPVDGKPVDRTTTGTPALQAATPDVSGSISATESIPMDEMMERTRARLAKLKSESLRQVAEGGAPDLHGLPSPPHTTPERGTPVGKDTGPPKASTPSALLPMTMATAVESPQPSTSTGSRGPPGADASSRAKLLERLAQERRAHLQDQEAWQRHGDGHEGEDAPYSGLGGGVQQEHARAEPALDAAAAAPVRRDAELREAALRAQARLRVSGPPASLGDRATDGGPSASSGTDAAVDQLRTREEALRARLRRK